MNPTQRRISRLEDVKKERTVKKLQLFTYDSAKGEYPPEKKLHNHGSPALYLIFNETRGQVNAHKNEN